MAAPTEARDSVSRALIKAQSGEIARLRERVAELEAQLSSVREELARGLPIITEAFG